MDGILSHLVAPVEVDAEEDALMEPEQEEEYHEQEEEQNVDNDIQAGREILVEDEAAILAAVKQLHTNLGHPSNVALARAIRLTGGSDLAVKTALNFRCTVCYRLREP